MFPSSIRFAGSLLTDHEGPHRFAASTRPPTNGARVQASSATSVLTKLPPYARKFSTHHGGLGASASNISDNPDNQVSIGVHFEPEKIVQKPWK